MVNEVHYTDLKLFLVGPFECLDPYQWEAWLYRLNTTGFEYLFPRSKTITDDQFKGQLMEWLVFYDEQQKRRTWLVWGDATPGSAQKTNKWKKYVRETLVKIALAPMIVIICIINHFEGD